MDIEELRITASLAHIDMDDAALAEAFPAFEQMLSFFQAMQAADKDGALDANADSGRPFAGAGHFRPDTAGQGVGVAPETMIAKAGETDGRFMVIPNVL